MGYLFISKRAHQNYKEHPKCSIPHQTNSYYYNKQQQRWYKKGW